MVAYEHLPAFLHIPALVVAGTTGLVAALAYMRLPRARPADAALPVDPERTSDVRENSAEPLSYLEGIRVPTLYREQWVALIYQAKAMKPLSLQHYTKAVPLGKTSDWNCLELSEVFKAVTAAQRRFTVELTNSDSILIHCDPVQAEASAETATLPELQGVAIEHAMN
jgi:hypothetical protein